MLVEIGFKLDKEIGVLAAYHDVNFEMRHSAYNIKVAASRSSPVRTNCAPG
jgi:hypothetical protein